MTLWIVGAGGFGRETLDASLAAGILVAGFADERLAGQVVRGLPVVTPGDLDGDVIVAIADPAVRRRLARELDVAGASWATVVHPSAVVGPETTLGAGSVVLALAHISSSVRVGRHAQVNYTSTIGHDAVLGDNVSVLPGANIGGSTIIGDDVLVGANAAILQGLTVGRGATVGAGAVVIGDVAEGTTVVGVPARPLRR